MNISDKLRMIDNGTSEEFHMYRKNEKSNVKSYERSSTGSYTKQRTENIITVAY